MPEMLILVALASGCAFMAQAPPSVETLIGEYVHYCADKGTAHEPDRLTLHADGKYVLVHMQREKVGSITKGTWRLISEPNPSIQFDHGGYPVRINGKHVRLMINDDLGEWYEKKER